MSKPMFAVDEKFVAFYDGSKPREASVFGFKEVGGRLHYQIRFTGFSSFYDDTIPVGEESGKMIKGTMKDFKRSQKEAVQAAKSRQSTEGPSTSAGSLAGLLEPIPIVGFNWPPLLKKVIALDHHRIHQHFEHQLPCRFTVDKIMEEYLEHFATLPEVTDDGPTNTVLIKKNLAMVKRMFNAVLRNFLLYKPERFGYNDLLKENAEENKVEYQCVSQLPNLPASELFGLAHLLRLFANFPQQLKNLKLNNAVINHTIESLQGFMDFLEENREKYWQEDCGYVTLPSYIRRQLSANGM
ncbi:hypothetical protein B9Z55_026045 [Caenorhabditis nigoni]|nr:hypothetical protein B9Z55_026045 [Caenorhabditis nigoni]